MPASPRPFSRFTNEGAGVAGNAEATVVVATDPSKPLKVLLHSFKQRRSAGASATNFRSRVYNVSGAAADLLSQQFRPAAAGAPGTPISYTNIGQPFYTDAAGKFYVIADGDAADTFEFECWLEVLA